MLETGYPAWIARGRHSCAALCGIDAERTRGIQGYFQREIFPVLTPLAFDPTHPFPHISNLSFNLAVLVKDPERGDCFARVKVPDIFPRLVPIPTDEDVALQQMGLGGVGKVQQFVWLEEVIAHNLDDLFPGLDVVATYPFRVTRDADVAIEEDEASDLDRGDGGTTRSTRFHVSGAIGIGCGDTGCIFAKF